MSNAHPSGLRRSVSLGIALVAALVLVFAFSVSAFAADYVVDNGTDPDNITCSWGTVTHASISAAALAIAPTGDTIKVCDGAYLEYVNFGSNSVTLLGESEAGTIIGTTPSGIPTTPGPGAFGLMGTAGVYTVKDLTIVAPHYVSSTSGRGIKFSASGVPGSIVTLENVTVLNGERTNIDLHSYQSAVLKNVTASGAKNGVGIGMTDVGSITLESITTSNNAWGGVALYTKRTYPVDVTNLTFAGTNSFGEMNAFQIELDVNAGNYYSAKNLDFANSGLGSVVASVNVGASDLWNFVTSANATAMKDYNLARYGNVVGPITLTAGKVHLIGKNGTDTISGAITAATAGDTIFVGHGTFAEMLTINKHLRLIGMGGGAALASNTVIDPGISQSAPVVTLLQAASGASGSPLLLHNLRINTSNSNAIDIPGGGTLAYVELSKMQLFGDNVPDSHLNTPGPREICLRVASSAGVQNLDILDSRIDSCDYGWYIANETVAGIDTFDGITVERTVFNRNSFKGIYAEKLSDATFEDSIFSNNGFSSNVNNANFNAGVDINLKWAAYSDIHFIDTHILHNALGFSEGVGITIKARNDGSYGSTPATLTNVTIAGGSIVKNERGVRFGEPQSTGTAVNTTPAVTVTGVDIHSNKALYPVLPAPGHPTPPAWQPSIHGDVVNWTTAAIAVNGSFLGNTGDPAILLTATGAGAITTSGTVSTLLNSSTISIPNSTSYIHTPVPPAPQNNIIRIPVVLDGYVSNIDWVTTRIGHDVCFSSAGTNITWVPTQPTPAVWGTWTSSHLPGVPDPDPASVLFGLDYLGYKLPAVPADNFEPVDFLLGGTLGYLVADATNCANGTYLFTFSNGSCAAHGGLGDSACTFTNGSVTIDRNTAPTTFTIVESPDLSWTTSPNVVFSQGKPPLTTVGTLGTTDATGFDRIYSFDVNDVGNQCSSEVKADHILFTIAGNELKAVRTFTKTETGPFHLCVRASDQRGGLLWTDVTVTLRDKPDSLTPALMSVAENATNGTSIGKITSVGDVDADDNLVPFVHEILSITPATGASYFALGGVGNEYIVVGTGPLTIGTYDVLIRSRGAHDPSNINFGLEQVIQVQVLNSAEVFVAVDPVTQNAVRRTHTINIPFAFTAGTEAATELNFTVAYDASCLQFNGGATLLSGGTVTGGSGSITFDLDNSGTIPSGNVATANFTALNSCPGNPLHHESQLTFSALSIGVVPPVVHPGNVNGTTGVVHIIDNSVRGDCNWTGAVNAADLSATVLEIFDSGFLGDMTHVGPAGFLTAPNSHFVGSPYGCDSNATGAIDAADISCTGLVIFGDACTLGSVTPASASNAVLGVANATAVAGQTVTVPLHLDSNGHAVSALTLKLHVDPTQLAFDPTDANSDGLPDALALNVAAPFVMMTKWDADASTLQIAILALANPLPAIADGQIATVTFTGLQDVENAISILEATAGNTSGQDVSLDISVGGEVSSGGFMFLPLIQ